MKEVKCVLWQVSKWTAYCKHNRNLNSPFWSLELASLVSGCTTALYNVTMADNGVEPRTSTTVIMRTFSMPKPHVGSQLASVISRASSIPHRVSWVGSVALDLLCDRAYLFGHQHRFSWAAVSCPLAIEGVQGQTELRWLWLKKLGKFPRHGESNEYLVGTS